MNSIINWFEIPTQDLDRAVAFYEHALELSFYRETVSGIDMALFPYEKPATGGALVKADMFTPSDKGTVIYLHTPDLNAALERVTKAGGKTTFGPVVLPEDIGSIALIIDSEGNRVGLHQPA